MTKEKLYELFGGISDQYLVQARETHPAKSMLRIQWIAVAACFAVIVMTAAAVIPLRSDGVDPISPITTEAIFETRYVYRVEEGQFSSYIGGKVIDAENVGEKISDVTVLAGWEDSNREWTQTEVLRGEVYAMAGIPTETAAVLKFLDLGEAVTTTHYYVILNPNADLQAVEQYRILPLVPNNPGEE